MRARAPVEYRPAIEPIDRENMMGELGFFALIHLALVVYALVQIFGSNADTGSKILWTLLVGLFPLFGLIIWFLAGPGTPKK
jgi:hypothetical protein